MKWALGFAVIAVAALWWSMRTTPKEPDFAALVEKPLGEADRSRVVAIVRKLDGEVDQRVQHIEPLQMSIPSVKADAVPYMDSFVANLTIRYALDGEAAMINISPDIAKQLGLSREELLPLAVKNLHLRYPDASIERGNGLAMVLHCGDLESSWMLDFEFWKEESKRVPGTLILSVPSRDVLVWTSSENTDAIATLKKLGGEAVAREEAKNSNRELSPLLFAWKADHWEVY